jgi:WD40 repeat protein
LVLKILLKQKQEISFKIILIVAGSRDHSIHLWSSQPENEEMKPVSKHPDVHSGWVWSMASQDDLLLSGAWDSSVRFWQVTQTGLQQTRDKVQLKTAVLSLDICENRYVLVL